MISPGVWEPLTPYLTHENNNHLSLSIIGLNCHNSHFIHAHIEDPTIISLGILENIYAKVIIGWDNVFQIVNLLL